MKTFAVLFVLMSMGLSGFAQKGHGHGKPHQVKQEVKVYNHYPDNHITVYNGPPHAGYKHHKMPYWAPAYGYRHRHIFFPEYGCYYDTYSGAYIYRHGGVWITSYQVPAFIINIGTTRKVELDIDNVPRPQVYFEQHISLYR